MNRILISDAYTRKGFDIISLVKSSFPNVPIILGNTSTSLMSKINFKLTFSDDVELLQVNDANSFVEDLYQLSMKYSNEQIVFLPVEEITLTYFYKFLERYGKKNFLFILPSSEVFICLREKRKLNEYCAANGINCPLHYSVKDLDILAENCYPLLLKPSVGSGAEGIFRLMSNADLNLDVKEVISKQDYLVQELIPNGKDVKGAFFLYNEGKFICAYTHERMRTSPPTGGVTILSKLSYNEDIIETGKLLLDHIGWNGLIMLEFLFDSKTNKYKIIEANPRIWGSIMLAEFSGKNLLSNYILLCLEQPLEDRFTDTNKYIRWFFPVDVLNYIKAFGKIANFWNFKDTCFINWSYSSFRSSVIFNFVSLFNSKNFLRFLRK